MRLITFRDTCTISRSTGQHDEWDNEIKDTIYEGECLYEEGGMTSSRSIITRGPSVYIPGNDTFVMINDAVSITTEQGRSITAIVKVVRDCNLPWMSKVQCTKIDLKQGQGE